MGREFYCQGSVVKLRPDWPFGFEAMDGTLAAKLTLSEEPETLDDWRTRDEIASLMLPAELLPEAGMYDGAHYHVTVEFEPEGEAAVRDCDDSRWQATVPTERIFDYSSGHGAYEAKLDDEGTGVTARLTVSFPFPDEPWFDEKGDECVVTIGVEYDHEMTRERQAHAQMLDSDEIDTLQDFIEERRRDAQQQLVDTS